MGTKGKAKPVKRRVLVLWQGCEEVGSAQPHVARLSSKNVQPPAPPAKPGPAALAYHAQLVAAVALLVLGSSLGVAVCPLPQQIDIHSERDALSIYISVDLSAKGQERRVRASILHPRNNRWVGFTFTTAPSS